MTSITIDREYSIHDYYGSASCRVKVFPACPNRIRDVHGIEATMVEFGYDAPDAKAWMLTPSPSEVADPDGDGKPSVVIAIQDGIGGRCSMLLVNDSHEFLKTVKESGQWILGPGINCGNAKAVHYDLIADYDDADDADHTDRILVRVVHCGDFARVEFKKSEVIEMYKLLYEPYSPESPVSPVVSVAEPAAGPAPAPGPALAPADDDRGGDDDGGGGGGDDNDDETDNGGAGGEAVMAVAEEEEEPQEELPEVVMQNLADGGVRPGGGDATADDDGGSVGAGFDDLPADKWCYPSTEAPTAKMREEIVKRGGRAQKITKEVWKWEANDYVEVKYLPDGGVGGGGRYRHAYIMNPHKGKNSGTYHIAYFEFRPDGKRFVEEKFVMGSRMRREHEFAVGQEVGVLDDDAPDESDYYLATIDSIVGEIGFDCGTMLPTEYRVKLVKSGPGRKKMMDVHRNRLVFLPDDAEGGGEGGDEDDDDEGGGEGGDDAMEEGGDDAMQEGGGEGDDDEGGDDAMEEGGEGGEGGDDDDVSATEKGNDSEEEEEQEEEEEGGSESEAELADAPEPGAAMQVEGGGEGEGESEGESESESEGEGEGEGEGESESERNVLDEFSVMFKGKAMDIYAVTKDVLDKMNDYELQAYEAAYNLLFDGGSVEAAVDADLGKQLANVEAAEKKAAEAKAAAEKEAEKEAVAATVNRDSHRGDHKNPSGGHNSAERAKYGAKCILVPSNETRTDIYDKLGPTRAHKKNGRSEMPMPKKTWQYFYPADQSGVRKPDKRLYRFVRNDAKKGQRGIRLECPTTYDPVNQAKGAMKIRLPKELDTFLDLNYFHEHQKLTYPLLEAVTLMRQQALLKAKLQDAAAKRQETKRLGVSRSRR